MSGEDPIEEDEPEVVDDAPNKTRRVPWLPLVIVLLVVPIITIAGMELVIIPKLKATLQEQSQVGPAEKAVVAEKSDSHGGKAEGKGSGDQFTSYKFDEMVTNLSGTMGTRFIKTSFEVSGKTPELGSLISTHRARVRDSIMTVLSSRTISELEAVGGRNSLRLDLIEAINSAVGQSVVEHLYFMELIIQ